MVVNRGDWRDRTLGLPRSRKFEPDGGALLPLVLDDAAHAAPLARLHNVEVAVRIDPDPMAGAIDGTVAPAGQALAVEGQDADHPAIVLGDVDHVVIVDIEECRADQLGRPDG